MNSSNPGEPYASDGKKQSGTHIRYLVVALATVMSFLVRPTRPWEGSGEKLKQSRIRNVKAAERNRYKPPERSQRRRGASVNWGPRRLCGDRTGRLVVIHNGGALSTAIATKFGMAGRHKLMALRYSQRRGITN